MDLGRGFCDSRGLSCQTVEVFRAVRSPGSWIVGKRIGRVRVMVVRLAFGFDLVVLVSRSGRSGFGFCRSGFFLFWFFCSGLVLICVGRLCLCWMFVWSALLLLLNTGLDN